jgi:hypothetical protein
MKRNTILVLLFVLVMGGSLLAGENATLKIKVAMANVRSQPDASAPVIAKVPLDTILEVLGKSGVWYKVSANDEAGKEVTGYIHKTVVEVSGEVGEEAEAEAQEEPEAGAARAYARGGFKLMGGLSLGNGTLSATLPSELKKTWKPDFTGGIGFETGGMFAFELDLCYSPGGVVIKATDPAILGRITIAANAITMPLMLKVRFLHGPTPYILLGGEVGYILNSKFILKASDGTADEVDILDQYERLVYGLVLGGGFEMRVGGMSLLLEGRYRLGLSNQIKDPDPGDYIKVTALTFLLGIKF